LELVKKPRAANVIHPFKRPKFVVDNDKTEPEGKKKRGENQDGSGNINISNIIARLLEVLLVLA
jgi:hypothetical protein